MLKSPPLVVDLDGTLTPSDTLIESMVCLFRRNPLDILRMPFWLLQGRAAFKAAVASRSGYSVEYLPLRPELLEYLSNQKSSGRRLILATASHRKVAEAVGQKTSLFDHILASDARHNLKGQRKLEAIRKHVGDTFVYAGDSRADLPIWKASKAAILVSVSASTRNAIHGHVPIEREFFSSRPMLTTWVKALRIHQWLKNLLIFVPLLTAFSFLDPAKLIASSIAFISFSLAASATYVVNDLLDLENDRAHPRKRNRPFASASISISAGLTVAAGFLSTAFVLALSISTGFTLMLFSYLMLTSAYSWFLKQYVLIDVLTLSLLYTLRILAGAVAIAVATSPWLLAFSVFTFLSLALVKRCSELLSLQQVEKTATLGRDYRVSDQLVLTPLGVASALGAVVVFGLYISSPEVQSHYESPLFLWLTAFGMIYWMARLWVKTQRGEMHDDPLVFALRDRGSRISIAAMLIMVVAARYIPGVHL